jgi:hypothetical protein
VARRMAEIEAFRHGAQCSAGLRLDGRPITMYA